MHKIGSDFREFHFVPRQMDEMRTPAAVVAVFHDLGMKDRWPISQETLSRCPFVLLHHPLIRLTAARVIR